MKRIICTGSGGPAGVNFTNSLRKAPEKFYLIGTDVNKYHLLWPNVDEKWLVPKFTEEGYLDKINELIDKTKADFIHPQPDGEVKLLSANREKLNCKTFLPSKKTVEITQDKFKSANIWKKAGLMVTNSVIINSMDDLDKVEQEIGYPYWLRATRGFSSRGSTPVEKRETAESWIKYWRSRGITWEFVAHEYLPGRNIAFQSIWKNGELITSQARVRIEYIYPYLAPSGATNTPVVAKTIHDDKLNKAATEAVRSIDKNASGIFCVDLKENKDGIPYPTEINAGRFFTTSNFFTSAGVNMPYYYIKLAFDEKIPELRKYNSIDKDMVWCRHIDCPAVLKKESDINFPRI